MPRSRASRYLAAFVLPLTLMLSVPSSSGTKVLTWTDANGNVHYGDSSQAPADAVRLRGVVPPENPSDMITINQTSVGGMTEVVVGNTLAGPVQVRLRLPARGQIQLAENFQIESLLPAKSRVRLGRLQAPADWPLIFDIATGDPAAVPRDVAYSLPVDENSNWTVGQTFNGGHSHSDSQNRYAVDIIVPEGTPVLAARAGIVMQAESAFDRAGDDREKYAARANLIRILHDDGSIAVYAHLQENGVYVRLGERVGLGQQIGASGNTGYSSGPHLHFAVQVNRGMSVVSIPFRMVGPSGYLRLQ
jgi:murein DD-endopeptidase MepM/ murein hydrolase activator NlpD